MAPVRIQHYTDPTCPFAFSAERQRLRLAWRYGDQLEWETRMVVLSEGPPKFPLDKMSESMRGLQHRYGMPIDWLPRQRASASVEACRAVVAARLHAPEFEAALLRRLRVLHFSGAFIDEPAVLAQAATEAGLGPGALERWMREPDTEARMREDMAAARDPSPAARAQDEKLGGPAEERRYTCPSLDLHLTGEPADGGGTRADLPGFRPIDVYDAALANLAPELDKRPDPESVQSVLAWAGFPLATVEVAAVCGRDAEDLRAALARVASFDAVGGDGYWTLN